jgi:hypothetical protein
MVCTTFLTFKGGLHSYFGQTDWVLICSATVLAIFLATLGDFFQSSGHSGTIVCMLVNLKNFF